MSQIFLGPTSLAHLTGPPHSLFQGLALFTQLSCLFAVAIVTTRGQFIKGEEVHFWGGSFPASVQSTAENKSPDTPEETHGKAFYQPGHHAGPETAPNTATFLPCRKIIPEQLVGARRPHPCIPQISLSLSPSPPALCLNSLELWQAIN